MTTWKIDPAHTDITFAARHMMVTTVRGKFRQVEGSLEIDEADPTRARGEIRIAAASIDTGVEDRDRHLRSPDFFAADEHPWIVGRLVGVEPLGDHRYRVTSEVTIRGVTRPLVLQGELLGFYTSMQGRRRVGVHLEGRLDREEWGLTWNVALEKGGWLVSKEIKLDLDIAAEEAEGVGTAAA